MRPASRHRQRGVALILVMWVFMILGVLALDFSRFMRDDAKAALNFVEETRGYYVAVAAMNKTVWQAMQARDQNPAAGTDPDATDPDSDRPAGMREDDIMQADGEWHAGTFGDAGYDVRVTDLGGRIGINRASEALLRRVIVNLLVGGAAQGMGRRESKQVDEIVDSILDWRDTDSLARMHGAESDYYMASRGGYPAKNGFFDDPQELLMVRGVTAELFYGHDGVPGLRDIVSIFGNGTLNARTMTAPVLQALLAIGPEEAEEVLALRGKDPTGFVAEIQAQLGSVDMALSDLIVDEPASTVLVEARADTKADRNQSMVAAVFRLGADEFDGPRVLRWFDRAPWTGALPSGTVPEGRS